MVYLVPFERRCEPWVMLSLPIQQRECDFYLSNWLLGMGNSDAELAGLSGGKLNCRSSIFRTLRRPSNEFQPGMPVHQHPSAVLLLESQIAQKIQP